MTKEECAKRIVEIGIIPVVRASSSKQALRAVEAVCAGGISVIEITMTVPGALDAISQLVKGIGAEVLIGAGTVLDPETAQSCIDAGAEFIVSPGFDLSTVKLANNAGKLMMAGALTPTEVIAAWRAGSDFVKIFPCSAVGGPNYIKALKAPLPQVPMVPTGGVNLRTAADFLQAGAAALGVGGDLISQAALNSGDSESISQMARQFIGIIRETRAANPAAIKS
jgi:2-dehydro-3-deoxyphosphogluconate aldolase / (4S)-4-hydroxy-2-oxoglutarate aldolase